MVSFAATRSQRSGWTLSPHLRYDLTSDDVVIVAGLVAGSVGDGDRGSACRYFYRVTAILVVTRVCFDCVCCQRISTDGEGFSRSFSPLHDPLSSTLPSSSPVRPSPPSMPSSTPRPHPSLRGVPAGVTVAGDAATSPPHDAVKDADAHNESPTSLDLLVPDHRCVEERWFGSVRSLCWPHQALIKRW